jgi:signal transduction histidine kinase
MLRHLKQLDTQWELDLFKEDFSTDIQRDSMADPPNDLVSQWKQLQALEATRVRDDPNAWTRGAQAYSKALAEKARLIATYRFHAATLDMSRHSLATTEDAIQTPLAAVAGHGREEAMTIAMDVYDSALSTLEYTHVASDERRAEVEAGLARLADAATRLSIGLQGDVKAFDSHARVILLEQPAVNALRTSIAAVPIAARLDDLTDMLTREQLRENVRDQRAKIYMMIVSAVLAALLLYVGRRLILSYGVINRANLALHESNEGLEQRVQERTRELEEAQSTLVATARQAGMAEIATNVLHNVGNVLNSVNISADLIRQKIRASKSQGLSKAVQMMNEHEEDLGFMTLDPKGKLLPSYLNQLVEALRLEKQGVVDELDQLTRSVDHIKEIVATQQTYAGASSILEPVQIAALLEDALRMQLGTLTRHQINVIKNYGDIPVLSLDKHRLLLILVNLISNAGQALSQVAQRAREMTLSADVTDKGALRIRVADNGEGIAPDNLTRMFAHGFTTRKDGHGFGLHSCALAAMEMEGTLTAQSDGPGEGAVFTLQVPVRREKVEDESAPPTASVDDRVEDRELQ